MSTIEVFFSYSHKDEILREELEKQLSLLKWQGLITGWYDRRIAAGQEWAEEIDAHLNTAQVVLLLVSPDFMASKYCYDIEVKRAIARHETGEAVVIPIIFRPVDWHTAPFGKLQALPKDGKPVTSWINPDEAFLDIARGIRNVIEDLNKPSSVTFKDTNGKIASQDILNPQNHYVDQCPYRGLFAFREEDEPYFFGREICTQQLVELVHRKPLVTIIGSSGSGKSSVVFAGLIPHLRREGDWVIGSFRPSSRPFRTLALALMPLLEPQLTERARLIESSELAGQLQQGKLALLDVMELIIQKQARKRFLLVIDQFEELYTLCRESEVRERFLDELISITQASFENDFFSFKFVFTLRADFVRQALTHRPFADALQDTTLMLGPMIMQELRDTIRKPAQMVHMQIEDGLTERILSEVKQGNDRLPLLEFALTLLWNKQNNGKLTHTAYEAIGGVEKALTSHAEKVFAGLSETEQVQAQRVFIQLVRFGEGTEDTRRLASRNEIGEDNWELVIRLSGVNARLVVSGRDQVSGEETVEIVHEALIRGWQRLGRWMEDNREFRTWQERLRAALRQWERSNRDDGALLHGVLLLEATKWLEQRLVEISQQERTFIDASKQYQEKEAQRWEEINSKWEEINYKKDLFITTASHELRTPLTAVTGYIELLRVYNEQLSTTERADFLSKAQRGCNELVLMIGSMMDSSRVMIDINQISLSPVSLATSVMHILEIMGGVISRERRVIRLDVSEGVIVMADEQRLRQIILNLVSNALKYSPEGSSLEMSAIVSDEEVTFCIRDFGLGIPPADQSRLFERLVRLERDINSPVRGAGMGLFISKQLINAMGGRIWVESSGENGKGSVFAFSLKRPHLYTIE